MRINNVDFPGPLFEAQKNSSLVVFAGAGVSMPPPSNFPNFDSLAEQVAAGVLTRDKDEPVDRFLGRLKDRGVEVHDKVRRILSDQTSKPNPLHTDLLRLFESTATVRVVTTNFDVHFTSAATSVFANLDDLEIYSAPALPRGNSFSGIVHLHGSVVKPANRLVLTDSDFGAAYLTEGWATRFLQQLFADNLVVFVGYGHNDIVVDYLARGLPPKSKGPGRFALAIQGTESHWKRLGITPVTYPVGSDSARHSALAPALKGWVDRIWTVALNHEERIKSIVQRPVSLDPEELDYIEGACKERHLLQFFTRYAKTPDWLRWVESKGLLAKLFSYTSTYGETDQQFAFWFAQHFACEHPEDAMAVLKRQGGFVAPLLWNQIALSFHQAHPAHDVVAKWTPLLVTSEPPQGSNNLLDYRLSVCRFPEDEATILLLFEHLTRPRIVLQNQVWSTNDNEGDIEITLTTEGSEYWLNHAWLNLLQPNLEGLADKLLLIGTSHIQYGYSLLRSFGKDGANWDLLSGSRGQIEAGGQGSPRDDGLGLLIDVVRDALRWTIKHRPAGADFFVNIWFSSGYRLLKRLAIFGVAESEHWNPDQKLNWLLENNLLHTYGYKPEVFLVLQKSYASASEGARIEILDRARRGSDSIEGRTREYEIFSLFYWLSKAAPNCPHTKKQFDEFAIAHPNFEPREHPDLDWWIGPVGWAGPVSPLGTDEILSSTPDKLLQELATAKTDDVIGPNREGLIYRVREAVTRQYGWSTNLVRALREKQFWEPDVWRAIIVGWKQSDLTEGQWMEVLTTLLETSQITSAVMYEASQLLESGIGKTAHSIPISCFVLSVRVGEKLWAQCTASDEGRQETAEEWLQVAINHPGGNLVTFWLRTLSRLREATGEGWNGIPEQYKQIFASVLSGSSFAAAMGRVLIASQLYFLFSVDQEWAIQNVLPLFRFSEDHSRAIQAWHGFLAWGTWTEGLLAHLMPCFEEAFSKLHSELGKDQRRSFCKFLAGIACHSSINPLHQGWLNRFLTSVTAEERTTWASSMLQTLKGMKEAAVENAWNSWIKTYWQNRIDGIPVPLEASETAEMLGWSICFKTSFADVADTIYKSPVPKVDHSFVYYDLSESSLPGFKPGAVAKFVLYLLKNRLIPLYEFDPIVKIVGILKPFPEARSDLLPICQQMAELGYAGAGALRNSILENGQP
jgi:SIR2-like protein/uncharacterized protein DUF4020